MKLYMVKDYQSSKVEGVYLDQDEAEAAMWGIRNTTPLWEEPRVLELTVDSKQVKVVA